MKKTFYLLVLFFLVFNKSNSQQTYHITYKDFGRSDTIVSAVSIGGMTLPVKKVDYKLVFNDTIAHSYFVVDDKDIDFKNNTIGKTIKNHSSYFFRMANIHYYGVSLSKRRTYLLEDKSILKNWLFLDSTKTILGYKCKLAYRISSGRDTAVAWYTPELPFGYGFYDFNNLPGVVLECISQNMGRHLIANKIEKTGLDIFFPEKPSIREYERRRE